MDKWTKLKEKLENAETYFDDKYEKTTNEVWLQKGVGIALAQQYMFDIEVEESDFDSNK